ncbi:MAG TPA: hypothetical protein VFA94_01065 [Acidimicrobiales bacterium]|nr:hypothetical protein [Acidimicrobiales bacterium]
MARLWKRVRRSEAGTSLVELSIAVALLAVVLPSAFTAVTSMQRAESTTTDRFAAQSEAQIIVARLTKDLRAAVAISATGAPFLSASDQDVTFYASLADPNGPTLLHAYVSNIPGTTVAAFHEDQTPPDAGSAPNYTYNGVAQPRITGKYVDTAGVIFKYYSNAGGVLTQLPTPITTLTALRSIETITITLVTHVTPTSPATTLTTSVHVRNVDYNPN